jgi:hypothetical protein
MKKIVALRTGNVSSASIIRAVNRIAYSQKDLKILAQDFVVETDAKEILTFMLGCFNRKFFPYVIAEFSKKIGVNDELNEHIPLLLDRHFKLDRAAQQSNRAELCLQSGRHSSERKAFIPNRIPFQWLVNFTTR